MPRMSRPDALHEPSRCFLSPLRRHFFGWCKASEWVVGGIRTTRPRHCDGWSRCLCLFMALILNSLLCCKVTTFFLYFQISASNLMSFWCRSCSNSAELMLASFCAHLTATLERFSARSHPFSLLVDNLTEQFLASPTMTNDRWQFLKKSLTINISIIYIIIYIILIYLLSQFLKTVICHNCHLSLPNRQHTH